MLLKFFEDGFERKFLKRINVRGDKRIGFFLNLNYLMLFWCFLVRIFIIFMISVSEVKY